MIIVFVLATIGAAWVGVRIARFIFGPQKPEGVVLFEDDVRAYIRSQHTG